MRLLGDALPHNGHCVPIISGMRTFRQRLEVRDLQVRESKAHRSRPDLVALLGGLARASLFQESDEFGDAAFQRALLLDGD